MAVDPSSSQRARAPTPEAAAAAPAEEAPPPPAEGASILWRTLVTVLVLLTFGLLILIPLSFAGLVELAPTFEANEVRQIQLLILSSFLLYAALGFFVLAGYRKRSPLKVGGRMLYKTKRDLVLNSLSIGATILIILLGVVEILALLAFMGYIEATTTASIAFASNYVMFATFSLLFLLMVVLARTSYPPRQEIKKLHKGLAAVLVPLSILVLLVSLLVTLGVLTAGPFAGVEPHQSVYIVTLAVLLQLIVFKGLLSYPALVAIALRAVVTARKAGKDMRDEIQRRAFRTYMIGLAFVLLSIFFLGGIATRQITIQEERTTNFLIIFYIVIGAVLLGVMVTRYLQHRYIEMRERRRASGEIIAKKRLTPDQFRRILIYSFSGFFATIFLIAGILTFMGRTPLASHLGTDLFLAAFLVGVGPYGFYHGFRLRRQRAMDEKLPDFLRDLAESERSGMTLPRALLTAAKGTYGALTKEVRIMSAQVEWGVSFTEALERFARRADTPLIHRAVVLIVEAANAGGNVVDILTAASDDAREIRMILEERKRQMAIYSIIIYIAFFVYLVVIFVLSAQFLPSFEEVATQAGGQQVGGLAFAAFDKQAFITVFYHGALIQAVGGGLVSGVMTGGSPVDGLKHSFILSIVAWVFFRLLL